jgi:hypothetical protein
MSGSYVREESSQIGVRRGRELPVAFGVMAETR